MRTSPLKRFYLVLALMAVTLITGMATGMGIFYRLVYIFALTTAISYVWAWLSMKALEVAVERRPHRARVGDLLEERIVVRNLSNLPRPVLEVEDRSGIPGFTTGMAVNLPPRGIRSWIAQGQARKRGVYTLGPLTVSCQDPFGLFVGKRLILDASTVVIYPRAHEIPEFSVPAAYLSGEISLRKRTHDPTPHAASVRDYAPGDNLSRVHWNSTARLGRLMSKEFDQGHSSDVWVVLDLHRDVQAGELEASTDEYAVSIGASLAKRFLSGGQAVGLIVYGDQKYLVPSDTGSGQLDRMMECLARSKAEGQLPLGKNLSKDEGLWTEHSTLVVVTTSPRHEWVEALRELARRRVRVAAVLLDGRSFGGFFDSLEALGELDAAGVPTYLVRRGDDIPSALSHPYSAGLAASVPRLDMTEVRS